MKSSVFVSSISEHCCCRATLLTSNDILKGLPISEEGLKFAGSNGGLQNIKKDKLDKLFGLLDESSIVYELYTRKNPSTYEAINIAQNSTYYIPRQPLIVLIHGWISNGQIFADVKEAYLKASDVNILVVNWSKIAAEFYFVSSHRVKLVGDSVAKLILSMMTLDSFALSSSMVHIVGHSLGAHVAGFAGRNLKVNNTPVRRITGLDPAGPLFETPQKIECLQKDDAEFVEIVHTNIGQLGVAKSYGDVDFYVNGGGPFQPGCKHLDATLCSHLRAVEYFAETVRSGGFTGTRCSGSVKELCKDNNKQQMGDATDENATGNYYLTTNPTSPYSKG